MTDYSENALIEQPAIALFAELGWTTLDCFYETLGAAGTLGRETRAEVVLVRRLRAALHRLNPGLSPEAIDLAVEELTRERSAMSPAEGNREVYQLLKDGVPVNVRTLGPDGPRQTTERVRVIDWAEPRNNDFFLASQLWVSGDLYTRRPDLVGFVNGLPWVLVELKAAHHPVEDAYERNFRDYRTAIPHLFGYNAFNILSNGSDSKIGSLSAEWEHFTDWKKINHEGEAGVISLETMIRGTCEPARLLDLVENFTLFREDAGGLIKLTAMNHQYLGVNNALDGLARIRDNQGRLGVFWHTQGSGKSCSMIFFAQKVLRTLPGNWTFVVVTDRDDLDDQIYKNFARCGVIAEKHAQAKSSDHLRRLLRENHRYVFTLIQKFRTDKGQVHPKLSDRSDIIVMADEAHRSQYDTLALNMRTALPHAAFIGFTGTPLMAGEEKTREVFGDYVSIYNFRQSAEDHATVPLYYENRIPELQLTNLALNEDIADLLDQADLSDDEERAVEREFAHEYHLITRDDRLEKIAADIVRHFMGRGFPGKAMVVCVDKATAVRMYDKVRAHWQVYRTDLQARLPAADTVEEHHAVQQQMRYMDETDMAVVVSQGQNEVEDLRKKGADIVPHRRRMVTEDLDEKFKNPVDPFRIVFVCAMWMTGFDAPSCSTIYLDKPMRNHTLMQTIARANRVFPDKQNGLIVDYIGVFRDLQKALAIYGSAAGGGIQEGDTPVKDKSALVEELRTAVDAATAFCAQLGVDLGGVMAADGFHKVRLLDEAAAAIRGDSLAADRLEDSVEGVLVNDSAKRQYLLLTANVTALFKAILPDRRANELLPRVALLEVIARKIRSLDPHVDVSDIMYRVDELLDDSVAATPYVIREGPGIVDLSGIDFEALRRRFAAGRQRTAAEELRGKINARLQAMVRLNRSRMDFLERFQQMIDAYNAGSSNVNEFFEQLLRFAQQLNDEERRGFSETLSEEALAAFDLLTRPAMKLSKAEQGQVKKVVGELLETLQSNLVIDWRKRQQTRAAVRLAIEQTLDSLPACYTKDIYDAKCEALYQHVFESYYGEGKSVYAA